MITIDQLLASVDLDFEPRFVTKDYNGTISIFAEHPECRSSIWSSHEKLQSFGRIKLSEFKNKSWQECIYEVPRKTTGKIERLETNADYMQLSSSSMNKNQDVADTIMEKINELVDMVNNIISVQEKMIDSRFVVDAVNELKGAKNE